MFTRKLHDPFQHITLDSPPMYLHMYTFLRSLRCEIESRKVTSELTLVLPNFLTTFPKFLRGVVVRILKEVGEPVRYMWTFRPCYEIIKNLRTIPHPPSYIRQPPFPSTKGKSRREWSLIIIWVKVRLNGGVVEVLQW